MTTDQLGVVPWWQVTGALAVVFALLMLILRMLHRWKPDAGRNAEVRLLSVRRLGPRRELQRLRVGDTVHTLYRQEGAMVVLGSEPWICTFDNRTCSNEAHGSVPKPRLKAWLASAGGRIRSCQPDDSQNH